MFVYRGKPVKQCNTRAFRDACAKAGIQGTRFHDLRHTWASWHVQSGTHTAKLRELGGWSNDQMVQRYAHLGREHLLEEVRARWTRTVGTLTQFQTRVEDRTTNGTCNVSDER